MTVKFVIFSVLLALHVTSLMVINKPAINIDTP